MAYTTKKLSAITDFATDNFKIVVTGSGLYGIAIRMLNATGGASVKGTVVSVSGGTPGSVAAQTNEFDSIGVVAEAGIAAGQRMWVTIQGVAEVLWKNSTSSTAGYVAIAADTDGRAINVAVPTSNPVVAEHFKEIGHVMETQAGGTNVLVNVMLHFN